VLTDLGDMAAPARVLSCVRNYTVSGKKIPNIIDCHLKKGYPISIFLVHLLLAELAIKLAFNILPHPMSAFALPR